MRAVVTDLVEQGVLGPSVERVVMDGGSAGGLTVLLHADYFASLLPTRLQSSFRAIGDAGWFRPDPALDGQNYTAKIRHLAGMMEAQADADCQSAHASDPAACMFAPSNFPFLSSTMFLLEPAYGSWQLLHIAAGFDCATYGTDLSACSLAQNRTLALYGAAMRDSVRDALSSTPHHRDTAGAFVPACILHVHSSWNEGHVAFRTLAAGKQRRTAADVVGSWLRNESDRVLIEDLPFGENPSCRLFT
jgi:hypothetical protein